VISAYRSTLPVHLNKKFDEIIIAKAEKEGKTSTENSSNLSILARFLLLLTILTTTFLKLVAMVVTQIGILPEFLQLLVVRLLQPLVLYLFVFFGVKYPQYVLIFVIAVWLIARAVGTNKKDKVAPIDESTDVKNVNESDGTSAISTDQIQSHKHHHHRHTHRSRHQEGEENRHRHRHSSRRNHDRPGEERSHHHHHHSRREEQESRRQHHLDHHDDQSEQSESSSIGYLETNNMGHQVENDQIINSRHHSQQEETTSVVFPDLSDDDESVSTLKSLNNNDDRPIVPSLLATPARETFDISSSSSSSSPSSSLPRTTNADNEVHDSTIVLSTHQLSSSSAASLLSLSNNEVTAAEHTNIESMLSLSSDEIFSDDDDENDVGADTNTNGNVITPNNETITDASRQHMAIQTLKLADMRFYDQYLSSDSSSGSSSVEEGGVQESPDNNINIPQDTNHTNAKSNSGRISQVMLSSIEDLEHSHINAHATTNINANSDNGRINQVMLRSIEDIVYSDTSSSESSKSESSLNSSDAVSSSSSL